MIKQGYHILKTAEGSVVDGPLVVELTEDGKVLSYRPLIQEEEATEWIGGEFRVKSEEVKAAIKQEESETRFNSSEREQVRPKVKK